MAGDTVLGLLAVCGVLGLTRELESVAVGGLMGGIRGGGILLLELGSSLDRVTTALALSSNLTCPLTSGLDSDLVLLTGETGLLLITLAGATFSLDFLLTPDPV